MAELKVSVDRHGAKHASPVAELEQPVVVDDFGRTVCACWTWDWTADHCSNGRCVQPGAWPFTQNCSVPPQFPQR
jgi:hypothetical protein